MSVDKPIRVLQLGNSTSLYGAERWILALVKYLPKDEIEAIISVIKDDMNLKPELCEHANLLGFKTHTFNAYGKFSFLAIKLLRQFIIDNRIDILHTHGYKTDIIGLLSAKGTGCKVISTPHGWTVNADFKLRCYEVLDRLILLFFDAVVPLSRQIYNSIINISPIRNKVFLIENGVDTSEIDDVSSFSHEMANWKCRDYTIIGYIGRLVPGKGINTLLKAFAALNYSDMRLAIVGAGEQLQELKDAAVTLGISDYVGFFGFRSDRIMFLRGFDIFVLPSRSEGIPRCLMEAMAAGIPIIATNIPGCRILIEDNVTGLLFEVDDHIELANKIKNLLKNNVLKSSLGIAGKNFIRNNYSAKTMADRYNKLYKSLAK